MTRQASTLRPDEIPAPALSGHAAAAWAAAVRSLPRDRVLSHADLMSLEAACRAWARYKAIEEKIEQVGRGNPLAGELAKGANGQVQVSALRTASTDALQEYRAIARDLGIGGSGDTEILSVDLFGYPDRPGRGQRGRPRFTPTQRDRNKVRLLLALGWQTSRIASAIEVSVPTLHKYFRAELRDRDAMRDRLDARRFEVTAEEALKGNITAMRELNRMVEQSDLMLARGRVPPHAGEEEPKPERLGKKAAALREAEEAGDGSDWGDDLKFPMFPN